MKCKPNELCKIIDAEFEENLGKLVITQYLTEEHQMTDVGPVWQCTALSPLSGVLYDKNDIEYEVWNSIYIMIPDMCLEPIRKTKMKEKEKEIQNV